MDLSSVDVRYVVKELNELIGGRVEKFYATDDRTDALIQIYARTKRFLRIMPGAVGLHPARPEYGEVPPPFAMAIRKHIAGTKLLKVEQQGFDRIILFTFGNTKGEVLLVVELIPPGNILLVRDGRIHTLANHHAFKDRTLRGGIAYAPPPSAFVPDDEQRIIERIRTSDKGIASTLAVTVGLGGVYAEEVCARAGVSGDRTDLRPEELSKVAHTVLSILDLPIAPHTDGKRAYPFQLKSKECSPAEGGFLDAIGSLLPPPVAHRPENAAKPKRERVATMIAAQERRIAELEEEIVRNQRMAERIYEEYQKVQEILAAKGDLPHGARKKDGMIEVDLGG